MAVVNESRPAFAFTGARGPKSAPVEGEHPLYSILTCAANELVRPVHAKSMPIGFEVHTVDEAVRSSAQPSSGVVEVGGEMRAQIASIVTSAVD